MKYTRISIKLKNRLNNLEKNMKNGNNLSGLVKEYNDILNEYKKTKFKYMNEKGRNHRGRVPKVSDMDDTLNKSVVIDKDTLTRLNNKIALKKLAQK